MIPVLVADLAQMSQRRVQVVPELQPLIDRVRDEPVQRAGISRRERYASWLDIVPRWRHHTRLPALPPSSVRCGIGIAGL
jgi:hypothetical protein